MKRIEIFEPWVFLFFGVFHLHRIWGIFDREAYADFWLGVMERRNMLYYLLMGVLAVLCVLGIRTFLKNIHQNYWWRWIYILGGSYLLFDLFAIAAGLNFWHELILKMYDISAPYWNFLWFLFILMGGMIFILGVKLLADRRRQPETGMNIKQFWKAVLVQDRDAIRKYFCDGAYVNWHCTNEHFTAEEFIQANCAYPGEWEGAVERIERTGDTVITVTHVYPKDKSMSFHVVSFIRIKQDKIISIDEYWSDDGDAPQWRQEMHIGRPIK